MIAISGLLLVTVGSRGSRADERGTNAPLSPIATPFALDLSGVRYGFVRALVSN
jgi:hypothetical protein